MKRLQRRKDELDFKKKQILTRTACEYKERGIRQDGIRRRRRTKNDDEPRLNKTQEMARAAKEIGERNENSDWANHNRWISETEKMKRPERPRKLPDDWLQNSN